MSDKFQNKYRIPSARLKNWDYGSDAIYFVTICTANRECYFGEIAETQNLASPYQMEYSELGKIANQCWIEIPKHFPFVVLDKFVVMPNHVHGIIIIDKPMKKYGDGNVGVINHAIGGAIVETQNFASLPYPQPVTHNKFGPQSKNLASIIRGFKIGVTKYARTNNIKFAWQSRFHDHIIRNDESFQRISNYIMNNPSKWADDKFYNKNHETNNNNNKC
jgi:putative transposase